MAGNLVYLKKNASDNFDSLIEGFDIYLRETDRGRSARSYCSDIRKFGQWLETRGGSVTATAPLDIVEYRHYLRDQGRKPSTVNRKLVSLRIFYSWLEEIKLVPDNPAGNVKPVATGGISTPGWLTRQEQAALVRAVRKSGSLRDMAVIFLMLHAGLRVGEVVSLKREDIKIGERSGSVTVRAGKGNKYRVAPLNKTVRQALSKWLEANAEGPLFPNRYGRPMSSKAVFDMVSEYAYRARIKATPHTLRHTFCKNAVDTGIPIDQIAAMAGHSSLDVTKKYTMPSMQDLQAAVEKMDWE